MKITNLKLFLSLAIFVGIANVDSTAATNIPSINIGTDIAAIGINANQKRIARNKIESNLIKAGQTISADVIGAKALNLSIVAANTPTIAAGLPIIESSVAVNDIDIQASLPIIL